MIRKEFQSICLNRKSYQNSQIDELCKQKINDEFVEQWEKNLFKFILELRDNNDFIKVKTSGSTGKPKNIQLSKESIIQSARLTNAFFQLNKDTQALLCLPTDFIAGKMMIVRAFVGDYNLNYVEPISNPLRLVKEQIDFAAMVPMQATQSLGCQKSKLEQIKNLIIGGGKIEAGFQQKLSVLPNSIYATYGMTETATHIALKKINQPIDKFFICMEGISVKQHTDGCLIIQAPHISSEKIITNDLTILHSETEFDILGRKDNVINSGGIKLIPEEIEAKISPLIDQNFFITSEKDEKLGERLVLLIENGKTNLNQLYNLWMRLEDVLGKYELPKKIDYLKAFKYTKSGKINRSLTQKMYVENKS